MLLEMTNPVIKVCIAIFLAVCWITLVSTLSYKLRGTAIRSRVLFYENHLHQLLRILGIVLSLHSTPNMDSTTALCRPETKTLYPTSLLVLSDEATQHIQLLLALRVRILDLPTVPSAYYVVSYSKDYNFKQIVSCV
ncbi:hypothetical protein BDB00DRAFT_848852 [Zychaea mexicana]|uniref:uncharacterized protein n=1 Tax=Zychaea mexicana TaxID=64656 RepID=UPI0022FE4900|nr:uncharacterized protein BDB00DRAFT_848852 [Zychaea mexicana]KAI9488283.1 hypothetical protein BDB00DRAFT_848852 [Zychaea mexicana]